MTSDARQALGILGEERACEVLRARGYAILARRYRTRRGEIDIVARDGATIVFVEVKTRQCQVFGSGVEAVGARKQQQIGLTATHYLARHRLMEAPARFDVVSVQVGPDGRAVVDVVRGAFDMPVPPRRHW